MLSALRVSLACFLLVAAACGSEGSNPLEQRALRMVEDMTEGRFADVRDAFDPTLQTGLTEESLRSAWEDFLAEHGEVRGIGDATTTRNGRTVVVVPLDMAEQDAEARVTFQDERVTGLEFLDEGEEPGG